MLQNKINMPPKKRPPPSSAFRPKEKTHDENLKIICLFCMRKGDRQISQYYVDKICKPTIPNFEIVQDSLPSGICATCRFGISSGMAINFPDYKSWLDILLNLSTDSRSSPYCSCFLCKSLKSGSNTG